MTILTHIAGMILGLGGVAAVAVALLTKEPVAVTCEDAILVQRLDIDATEIFLRCRANDDVPVHVEVAPILSQRPS